MESQRFTVNWKAAEAKWANVHERTRKLTSSHYFFLFDQQAEAAVVMEKNIKQINIK